MFFVYVLGSELKSLRFYVGMSSDVENRILEHNSGKTKSIKGYRPWMLFYYEKFNTRAEAREREKYLKSGTGKEKIKLKWQQKASAWVGREHRFSKRAALGSFRWLSEPSGTTTEAVSKAHLIITSR